jgi:hypothetical protein
VKGFLGRIRVSHLEEEEEEEKEEEEEWRILLYRWFKNTSSFLPLKFVGDHLRN